MIRMPQAKSTNLKFASLTAFVLGSLFLIQGLQSAAFAQTVTSSDPYVGGTHWTAPNQAADQGPFPAIGSGSEPMGTNPGQTGSAALMPWNSYLPANQIDLGSSQISLPGGPGSTYAPYTMGMSMSGSIPAPPSAQGAMPSLLQVPAGQSAYAAQVDVPDGGVLPGDSAPITRSGRSSTQDFGLLRDTGVQTNDFGYPSSQNPDRAQTPQVTDVGPRAQTYPGQYGVASNTAPNLPNSFYVNMGTGTHTLFQGPDLRARQTIAPY